jgi:2-polyprenyl-3-methyl-5-hydroxy-6-metoxy-1,4-benzoquinol methylase
VGADSDTTLNAQRLAELAALVDAVKERVRAEYPQRTGDGATGAICVGLPDLTPLARARDAAAGKMAAIGTVNPRAGGVVNNSIQSVKRTVARALNWFVRDQVIFNRQMIACIETCIETLADVNRTIHNLAGQTNTQIQSIRGEAEPFRAEAVALRAKTSELQDVASHWVRWREEWQLKLHKNEVEFLKSVADLNTAMQQKVGYIEAAAQYRERRVDELYAAYQNKLKELRVALDASFQKTATELDDSYSKTAKQLEAACQATATRIEAMFAGTLTDAESNIAAALQRQHDSFEQLANGNAATIQASTTAQIAALAQESRQSAIATNDRLTTAIQELQRKFYDDLDRIRAEYERVIHAELRVVRQRMAAGGGVPSADAAKPAVEKAAGLPFDYARFAERFRGPEEYVSAAQRFYVPYFTGRRHVLDVGCGRGEFLKLMQEAGVPAKGIEAGEESAAYCRSRGLEATRADLFAYLAEQPEGTLDGIFCSQVAEHLASDRLPEMVRLCASRLATEGILVIETPDPECLAIFGTHFYLDPTHTRPVPSQLLAFYMEEFGMGRIEVHRRAPAIETMPEVGELPEAFRNKFFGGLDYAIIAYKL